MTINYRYSAIAAVLAAAGLYGCGGAAGGGSTMGGYSGMNMDAANRVPGSEGTPTSGGLASLPANRILYSVVDPSTGNVEIRQTEAKPIKETDKQEPYVVLPQGETGATYQAFAPHPTVGNSFLFAYRQDPEKPVGIYRNNGMKFEGAAPIVPPGYEEVTHLQLTPDGSNLVYIATAKEGRKALFRAAAAGTSAPIALDDADQAFVSPSGDIVVYSKAGDLYQRPIVGEGEPKRLTESPDRTESFPALSRDGKTLVFSAEGDLFAMQLEDPKSERRLTQTPELSEVGASFSEDGNKIAYAAQGKSDQKLTGLYVLSISGGETVQILANPNIGEDVVWTGQEGRGIGGFRSGFRLHLLKPSKTQ